MRHQPTEQEGKESLIGHAAEKAWEARQVYGQGSPGMSMENLEVLLQDRKFIRYPVQISYDAETLEEGETAHPQPIDPDNPSAGFVMFVHPSLKGNTEAVPLVVAYQLVTVNYGDIAGHEAAEHFGSILMGMDIESYYQQLCHITDNL